MGLPSINTREDLDAIAGTPEHAVFMALLAGTLWRLEKDGTTQAWAAIENNSTIERFNFTRADFPGAQPPALPEPRPLTEVRAEKLAQLEQSRRIAIDSLPPVTVGGKQYPATPEYREVITGIARRQAAGSPAPGKLRGTDGTPVTVTPTLIGQVDDAITASIQAQWDRYWARFDAVQAATAAGEINAVEW